MIVSLPPLMNRRRARTIYWGSSILTTLSTWLIAPERMLPAAALCGLVFFSIAWWWTPFVTRKHPSGFNDVFDARLKRIIDRNSPPINRYDKANYKDADCQVEEADSDGRP